ncbi:MAG: ATP synthase F1 subunit epsilon [Pseudomonadota bacterium]
MTAAFHLQIISPAAIVVDAHVPMAQIPGLQGDFGVLPGHAPFFSMIRPGVIDVQFNDGFHRRFFAASGYADVTPTRCTVISDHIQDVSEISLSDAEDAIQEARRALAGAKNDSERTAAQKLLETSEALSAAVRNR